MTYTPMMYTPMMYTSMMYTPMKQTKRKQTKQTLTKLLQRKYIQTKYIQIKYIEQKYIEPKCTHLEANTLILHNLCFDTLNHIFSFLNLFSLINLFKVNKQLNEEINKNRKVLTEENINKFAKKIGKNPLDLLQADCSIIWDSFKFTIDDFDVLALLCLDNYKTIKAEKIIFRKLNTLGRVTFSLVNVLKKILSFTNEEPIIIDNIKLSVNELAFISSLLNLKFNTYFDIEIDYTKNMCFSEDIYGVIKNLKDNERIRKLSLPKDFVLDTNCFSSIEEALKIRTHPITPKLANNHDSNIIEKLNDKAKQLLPSNNLNSKNVVTFC